jgi:hypothetical protein
VRFHKEIATGLSIVWLFLTVRAQGSTMTALTEMFFFYHYAQFLLTYSWTVGYSDFLKLQIVHAYLGSDDEGLRPKYYASFYV